MRIEARRESHAGRGPNDYGNHGGDIVVTTACRWVRFACYYGTPPGSHIGLWRTRWGGLRGINIRIGQRYRRTLTLFVHTHPAR